jgi:hypothetical protein
MEIRIKEFSNTEYLKDYPSYAADTEGNIWSFKYNKRKKLSPGLKKNNSGSYVRLTDRFGRIKNHSVGRLIALCFLPTNDLSKAVIHKNGNLLDNRLENLEWHNNRKHKQFGGYVVDDFLADKIKQVYAASVQKGLKVDDTNTFFNMIVSQKLDEYVNQYGLRRFLIN